MKALSFLEFFGLTPQEKRDYLDSIELISKNDYKDRLSCDDSELFFCNVYYELVSKPFEIQNCNYLYVDDGIVYTQPVFIKDKEYMTIIINDFTFESYPKTVDDFITLCNLANFKLSWSKQ